MSHCVLKEKQRAASLEIELECAHLKGHYTTSAGRRLPRPFVGACQHHANNKNRNSDLVWVSGMLIHLWHTLSTSKQTHNVVRSHLKSTFNKHCVACKTYRTGIVIHVHPAVLTKYQTTKNKRSLPKSSDAGYGSSP